MLGVEFVCAFLPQTGLFVPFAAFFVAFCLLLCIGRGTWRLGVCLLLGAVAGAAAASGTQARLEQTRVQYAGRRIVVQAEVEHPQGSYLPGRVDAVLHVKTVNGTAADFRTRCGTLPECSAGEQVRCTLRLEVPERAMRRERYADGIALDAEYLGGFERLGESDSFRARTARLQKRLSASLRRRMDGKTGGVAAAMTVGDRGYLSAELRSAYRGAGLSHVLVVSGLHVSILCGEIFRLLLPGRREKSYRSRKRRAVFRALLAVLLAGVTGFTPSVCRAAVAVWVGSVGVWVRGAPDTLTSLAAAGILMTAGNSYAVWDIGFQLSFAAVLGTVAGGECIRRLREWWHGQLRKKAPDPAKRPWFLRMPDRFWGLAESACVSVCASAATFPVLVLNGLSVSIWAAVSSVTVLWMVQPILLLSLGTAFAGLIPHAEPVYGLLSRADVLLTGLLNRWAVWIGAKPGAGIYFDTAYAALVCLLLLALFGLALHWKIRLRVAAPCLLLAIAVSTGLGNALSRDLVHIDLVGSANAPAVVVAQNDTAIVLLRGGEATRQAVEHQLARRGVRRVELVVDLRSDPQTEEFPEAERTVSAEKLAAGSAVKYRCIPAAVELLRTRRGTLVRLTVGNRQFVTLSGEVTLATPLRVQWLLASPAKPDAVRWEKLLALGTDYRWMETESETLPGSISFRRHGGLRAE